MLVSKLEKSIGMEVYATHSFGVGGVVRQFVEDFVVNEVLVDGSIAEIESNAERAVLGSSPNKNRYLLCVLFKRNWDTLLAVRDIARQLGVNVNSIDIAGIKDAKAITAQHITIEDVPAEEIAKVQVKDIQMQPIGYLRNKISSYFLLGNSFCISIRNTDHSKATIDKRIIKSVKELEAIGGVPNFFGHQRFGTTRPITHLVGKALVKGNIEKAVMLFLAKPSVNEHPESREARKQLQATQDFKLALKEFPRKLYYEYVMLKHLAKRPDDFQGAFRRLPIKLRKLFPQAYQSYLFNKFLSKRIENKLPLRRAEVGDYVVNLERSGLPMTNMYKMVNLQMIGEINKAIESGKMRVAVPLLGFRRHPSHGFQGEIEKEILDKEGVKPEVFRIVGMPEISSKGDMRTVLTLLNNFSYKVDDDSANPAKRKAELSFKLHRGSYATVFLREIMKPRNPVNAGF